MKEENIILEAKVRTKQPKGQGDEHPLSQRKDYRKTFQFKLILSIVKLQNNICCALQVEAVNLSQIKEEG